MQDYSFTERHPASGLCCCLIGNSSEFPMRQNAPLRCAARRWEDRFAILLARLSSAALPSGVRGWGSRSPLADFVLIYNERNL